MKCSFLLTIILLTKVANFDMFKTVLRSNNPEVLGRIMISYAPNENHVVAISKANLTQQYGNQFHFIYVNYIAGNYTVNTVNLPFNATSARSNHQNYNDPNISNRRFLILDYTKTVIYENNQTMTLRNWTFNDSFVVDYCFQTNRDEFYTLQRKNLGDPYMLGYYSLYFNWSRRINITQNYTLNQNPVMKCIRSSLYLNFTSKVKVYSLNQSLWNLKNIEGYGNLSNLHAFGQAVTVHNNSHILIFNSTTKFSLSKTVLKNSSYQYFSSLYFGSNSYLFIARKLIGSNVTNIAQYDMQINTIVVELTTNISGSHMEMVHNLIFHYQFGPIIPTAMAYSIDVFHPAFNGTSCHNTYTYQSFTNYESVTYMGCVKHTFNLLACGGYSGASTSILRQWPYVFLVQQPYNIYKNQALNPAPISGNITSYNSSTNNNSGVINNSNGYINFALMIGGSQICLVQQPNDKYCIKYCRFECRICNTSSNSCIRCQYPYTQAEGQDLCQISLQQKVLLGFVTNLYAIKAQTLSIFYLFIDEFKFHYYHKVNYTGTFAVMLHWSDIFVKNCWVLVSSSDTMHWAYTPFSIPSYSYYTNQKFSFVQRSDSFFLQNMKDYLFLNIPLTLAYSLFLKKIFKSLSKTRFRILFHIYSFKLNLIMAIVVQNIGMMTYLACQHFFNLFYFDSELLFLQALCVILIGLIFIFSIAFFFISPYISKKARIFLINIRSTKGSYSLMFLTTVILPIIKSSIHSFFYNSGEFQLLMIATIEILNIFLFWGLQLKINIFKCKGVHSIECLLNGCYALLNILLYLKHYRYSELDEQFQGLITLTLILISSLIVLKIFYHLFYYAVRHFRKRTRLASFKILEGRRVRFKIQTRNHKKTTK